MNANLTADTKTTTTVDEKRAQTVENVAINTAVSLGLVWVSFVIGMSLGNVIVGGFYSLPEIVTRAYWATTIAAVALVVVCAVRLRRGKSIPLTGDMFGI